MKKEIADKWIEALRSGKYKQGRGLLRTCDDKFCCLGVLSDIYNTNGWIKQEKNQNSEVGWSHGLRQETLEPQMCFISNEVKKWAEMKTTGGQYGDDILDCLYILNDSEISFNEIADVIEKNWETL